MFQKNPPRSVQQYPPQGGAQQYPRQGAGQHYTPPVAESSFYDGRDASATRPFVRAPKVPELYKPPYFVPNGASFIMMLVGTIFFLIAFGGTSWYVVPPEDTVIPKTFGLWRLCVRTECVVDMTNDYMVKQYLVFENDLKQVTNKEVILAYERFLVSVKTLMSIGVVFLFLTVASNIAFILGYPTIFFETGAQLLTGVLVGVAVILFGGNFRDKRHNAPFGWSYWCGVVAAIILICNGAAMAFISYLVFRKRGQRFGRK